MSALRPPTLAARPPPPPPLREGSPPPPFVRGGGNVEARPALTARDRAGLSRRPSWPARQSRRPGRDVCIPNAECSLGLRAALACIRNKTSRLGALQTWLHCAVWYILSAVVSRRQFLGVAPACISKPEGDYLQLFVDYLKLFVVFKIIGIIGGLFVEKCSVFSSRLFEII